MAIWPGAVASNSNLYVAVDFPNSVTALNGAINSSVTSINVTNATNYPSSGGFILIDSELIYFAGISGNTLTGCLRGQDGTLPAAHLNNAGVNLVTVAEHHNVLKDEIIAIETSLNLIPSLALVSNVSGRVDVSSTTSTEIGYVHGVTSAIQTQLSTKIDTAGTGLNKIGTTLNLSIPVSTANGGTGQTSYTDGQLLIGSTSGSTLNKSTLTGTVNQITVTNGSGSITLSTPQNIASTSSPTFAGLSLTGDQTITVSDSSTTEVLLALTNNGTGQAVMSFTANSATNYVGTNTNGGFYMATAEPIGVNSFLFYAGGILQLASSGPINFEPGTNVVVASGNLSVSSGALSANSANLGGAAAASAILTLTSTTQGLLPPRMTTTQKNAISSPATGLVVYDTTLNKLCVFTGSVWETITSS